MFDSFYSWCGSDAYYRIIKSAVSLNFGHLSSNADIVNNHGFSQSNKLICFDEWVENSDLSVTPSLAELLVMSALITLLVGAFLFLALPETHHVALTDVEDVYDVSEYDLYFGCCPHGKGAGYLGTQIITSLMKSHEYNILFCHSST
jgi:hypothetical protein